MFVSHKEGFCFNNIFSLFFLTIEGLIRLMKFLKKANKQKINRQEQKRVCVCAEGVKIPSQTESVKNKEIKVKNQNTQLYILAPHRLPQNLLRPKTLFQSCQSVVCPSAPKLHMLVFIRLCFQGAIPSETLSGRVKSTWQTENKNHIEQICNSYSKWKSSSWSVVVHIDTLWGRLYPCVLFALYRLIFIESHTHRHTHNFMSNWANITQTNMRSLLQTHH